MIGGNRPRKYICQSSGTLAELAFADRAQPRRVVLRVTRADTAYLTS